MDRTPRRRPMPASPAPRDECGRRYGIAGRGQRPRRRAAPSRRILAERPSLTVSQEDGFAALDFPGAAWASRQTLGERDDQSPAQGCDRVWDVAFGSDRGRLWVDDRREAQAPGGERRCRVWRGDESLAIPGLQNARARSLA